MGKRVQYRRLLLLAVGLGAAFAGLGYRLVDLQLLRHEELSAKAAQNTEREILREPRRGDIVDVRGNLLATSVFVKTVCADPVLIGDRQADVARCLAPLLHASESELYQRLLPRLRQNDKGETITNRYVVLQRKVPSETWEKIHGAMAQLSFGVDESKLSRSHRVFLGNLRSRAIFADPVDDQQRVYPNQTLAAHVLGFVGMAEREVDGTRVIETSGKEGIEAALNSKLAGVRGWRVIERDRRGHELVALRDQDVEPRDGLTVVLSIDSVIQHIVESALAEAMKEHTPISISGIAIRPRTGEILAMATLPTFDPNSPGSAPPAARRDRAITDVMEPGSTFKVVVVSGALNDHVVTLNDTFFCEHGHFAFAGRVLHDHESYGVLTVKNIITKSSNIGAAKIGIRLGANRLYDYIRAYGFGSKTGIPLPEASGYVPEVKKWYKVSLAQIPMGHGISVTRLQMAMAMSAIANHGVLMRPMLVERLEDRRGNTVARYSPQPARRVISEATAKLMVSALKTVVSPEGTAPKAALEHYTVAGKTGTAQKAGVGGYQPGKYFASFVGFFPADDPELCISVVLDQPKHGYYGGQVAAPVFKKIAEGAANYLNIRPDRDDNEPGATNPVAVAPDGHPIRTVFARER